MKLLVAVDFSSRFESVIAFANRLGCLLNARIWLLHVAEPNPELVGHDGASQLLRDTAAERFHEEHRQLQQAGDELRKGGLDCVALLIQGDTGTTILNEAEKLGIDMIVLGPHGKGAVKNLLLGSTCDDLIKRSTIPLIVVPPHADM